MAPRGVWLALLLYLATRIVQVALVAWLAPPGGSALKDRLLIWDGPGCSTRS